MKFFNDACILDRKPNDGSCGFRISQYRESHASTALFFPIIMKKIFASEEEIGRPYEKIGSPEVLSFCEREGKKEYNMAVSEIRRKKADAAIVYEQNVMETPVVLIQLIRYKNSNN